MVDKTDSVPNNMVRPRTRRKEIIEDLYVRSIDRVAEFYGIDGCRSGWFYVGVDSKGECQFGVLEKFSDVGLFANHAKLTLVDIPIGLASSKYPTRLCDTAARKAITPRGRGGRKTRDFDKVSPIRAGLLRGCTQYL